MEANKSDHTPTPDASELPQWRRVLAERIAAILAEHDGTPTDPWEQREEATNRARTVIRMVDMFVEVVGDADRILEDALVKIVQLSQRPTLADVLGTLEVAAAKAPTLTEGAALRDVAARFRRVYGGGK